MLIKRTDRFHKKSVFPLSQIKKKKHETEKSKLKRKYEEEKEKN